MNDKDVVTREQVFKWYRLAGMDDMFTETRVAMLADFAIFAREDARRTVSGQEAIACQFKSCAAPFVCGRTGKCQMDNMQAQDVAGYAAPIPATELTDAERYRFLRDEMPADEVEMLGWHCSAENWDAEIDVAILAAGKEKP